MILGRAAALLLLLFLTVGGQSLDDIRKRIASFPPDRQVYELWRFWLTKQPLDVQRLFDKDDSKPQGLALYRKELLSEGDSAAEADRKIRVIDKDGEKWEIERWNVALTNPKAPINQQPNAFLVEMVKGRKPGRALDVGMGNGRNALWLASQAWDVTGYDPADRAVALARTKAAEAGLKLNAVVAKDSDFDIGTAKWDLILLSYVEIRDNAPRVIRALAPGGIVVAEYFHENDGRAPGGLSDNELLRLFGALRILKYEDAEGIGDFGMQRSRLVRICAEKRASPLGAAGAEWKSLFDGKTLEGWMWSTAANPPQPSWAVRDGALVTTPGRGKEVYLLTTQSFSDFELEFEWKGEPGVNSGIKYRFQGFWSGEPPNGRVTQQPDEVAGRIEPIALEYQIADDLANKDALSDPKHACAALYEYWPATKDAPARPDIWHTGRIVARGTHIEHWLDGKKVVDVDLDLPQMKAAFAASPRKRSSPLLMKHERRDSPIALQIHDGVVAFRNLRIRPLF